MTSGRIFVFLIFIIGGVGTAVNGGTVYIRLLYLGALLILIAWLSTAISLRGVKVDRQARSLRASVGDIFEEHFEISNTSLLPKLWLEIANETNDSSGNRFTHRHLPAREAKAHLYLPDLVDQSRRVSLGTDDNHIRGSVWDLSHVARVFPQGNHWLSYR